MADKFDLAHKLYNDLLNVACNRDERTNETRAHEASLLLDAMHVMTGIDPDPEADGPETCLSDMIAHLAHFAEHEGLDFQAVIDRGLAHWEAETNGG